MAQLLALGDLVQREGACALPGVSLKYDTFLPVMWASVKAGFVSHEAALFVAHGLRYGFDLGVNTNSLQGHRWFRNYGTAVQARTAVTKAIDVRVLACKTMNLGVWNAELAEAVQQTWGSSCIFPMGAVAKKIGSDMRPTDDHTRTGLNAATDMSQLRHTLETYKEISTFFKHGYFMRVSDVEAAFPLLPLHPSLWPYFMFRFFASDESTALSLFAHLCADFGAAGTPGTFKIFFVDVVVNMARALRILTLNMPIYVDDLMLIGASQEQVDAEMEAFHAWAGEVCGVIFKAVKDKVAAQHQLALGLWWDSRTFTRTLEESKLLAYVDMLAELSQRHKVTLHELQVAAGRMQRAVLTLPPGAACLLVSLFTLMAGLVLPWHARRMTRAARLDMKWLHRLLKLNLGRGFYTYEHFPSAPEVRSDASKSAAYAGGGWVSRDGMYHYYKYGTRAARQPIDYLEGDTVVFGIQEMGARWRQCTVPFGIDNSAFQLSLAKNRSRAPRLNNLVREAFAEQVRHECIVQSFWLSSEDNLLADDLSRDREADFLAHAYETGFWHAGIVPERHPAAGTTRVLPETRGSLDALRRPPDHESLNSHRRPPDCELDDKHTPDDADAAPASASSHGRRRSAARGGRRLRPHLAVLALLGLMVGHAEAAPQASTVPHERASLFAGLPYRLEQRVDELMDNRLSTSSWRTINAAVKRWRVVAGKEGWSTIIPTDDPERGGKLVTFVLDMVEDSDLVYSTIEGYVWGLRTWMKHQRQADPVAGVMGFDDWLSAVKVVTWVPHEPRKATPLAVVASILHGTDQSNFRSVQLALFLLVLLYTFSRSECPCPKHYTGRDKFDPAVHWTVSDFVVATYKGVRHLRVRFKVIKQDKRVERPEAQGDGDWVCIGEVLDSIMCPVTWFQRFCSFFSVLPSGRQNCPDAPFFIHPDEPIWSGSRPYIYARARDDFRQAQRDAGVPEADLTGLHGLRVRGYNDTKAACGEDLAVAHGGWKSTAHTRYDRFTMERVLRIAPAIAGQAPPDEAAAPAPERPVSAPAARLTRRAAGTALAALAAVATAAGMSPPAASAPAVPPDGPVDSDAVLLPDGWEAVFHPAGGRSTLVFRGPRGEVVATREEAWRIADAAANDGPAIASE